MRKSCSSVISTAFFLLYLCSHVNQAQSQANFNGWHEIPGNGVTSVADSVVAFGNKVYLFAIGGGDHAHYMNVFDGATWTGWKVVPGGGTTNLSDAATVYKGALYLFAIGGGDHAHYMNVFDGATWTGWKAVPGGGTTNLADTAATYNNGLLLFGIGIGDERHYLNIAGSVVNPALVKVRVAGTQYFEFDSKDSGDHFSAQNGFMCVTHNPGCGIVGNGGEDKFFSALKPLPAQAQIAKVEFLPYAPPGLSSYNSGTIGGWGSYGARIKTSAPDGSQPNLTAVDWNNACQGVYGGKNVYYSISFIISMPLGTDLGEATFDTANVTPPTCQGFTSTPPTPLEASGFLGTVKICKLTTSAINTTLHIEAMAVPPLSGGKGDTSMTEDISVDFPAAPVGQSVSSFKTAYKYQQGTWKITKAQVKAVTGMLPGLPLTVFLPGGPGSPVLDFTGGPCN